MNRWVVCGFIILTLLSPSLSYTDVSPELESVIQQLDWDMTRTGTLGRRARNRAVTKLICVAEMGKPEKERVFKTVGRLLDHDVDVIVEASWRIINELQAEKEIDEYRQAFLIRNGYPSHHREVLTIVNHLLAQDYKGIEFIKEFY